MAASSSPPDKRTGLDAPMGRVSDGWGDLSPEVVSAMRVMFPPRVPHLHERF